MVYPQPFPDHIRAVDLRAQLGPAIFNSYFSFAIVRNPWDWQVSLYQFTLKNPLHHQYELIEKLGSFDEYLRWRCDREIRLQKDFICDNEGQLLVDFVGRFEQIDRDFREVCRRIGVDVSLPKINVSNSRPYREYYTEKTTEMVRRAFEEDILEFGYDF